MAILSILLTVIIIAVSILLVLIVLVQRPKQEGLGAAFGGGTLDSALGAHTTDVLQKMTTYLGIIFFVSAIGLAMVKARQFRASAANDVLEKVENRETSLPGLPPELSGLPGLEGLGAETPAPVVDDSPAPAEDAPASTEEAPAPAPEKGKAKESPKAEGGKAKAEGGKAEEAPKPKAETPAPPAEAPAEN